MENKIIKESNDIITENTLEEQENKNFMENARSIFREVIDTIKESNQNDAIVSNDKETIAFSEKKQTVLSKLMTGVKSSLTSLSKLFNGFNLSTLLVDVKFALENAFMMILDKISGTIKNLISKNKIISKFTEILTNPFSQILILMLTAAQILPKTTKFLFNKATEYLQENFPKLSLTVETISELLDEATYTFAKMYKYIADKINSMGGSVDTSWASGVIDSYESRHKKSYDETLADYRTKLNAGTNPITTIDQRNALQGYLQDMNANFLSEEEKNGLNEKINEGIGKHIVNSQEVSSEFASALSTKEILGFLSDKRTRGISDQSKKILFDELIKKAKLEGLSISSILAKTDIEGNINSNTGYSYLDSNLTKESLNALLGKPKAIVLPKIKNMSEGKLDYDESGNLFTNTVNKVNAYAKRSQAEGQLSGNQGRKVRGNAVKNKFKENVKKFGNEIIELFNFNEEKPTSAPNVKNINLGSSSGGSGAPIHNMLAFLYEANPSTNLKITWGAIT